MASKRDKMPDGIGVKQPNISYGEAGQPTNLYEQSGSLTWKTTNGKSGSSKYVNPPGETSQERRGQHHTQES
jgi:hypothetical protein